MKKKDPYDIIQKFLNRKCHESDDKRRFIVLLEKYWEKVIDGNIGAMDTFLKYWIGNPIPLDKTPKEDEELSQESLHDTPLDVEEIIKEVVENASS